MKTLAPIPIPFPNLLNIIPDSSWLLNSQSGVKTLASGWMSNVNGIPSSVGTQLFAQVPNVNRGFLGALLGEEWEFIQPYVVPNTWILVDEVLEEIATLHEKSDEKRQGTGHAKLVLREIMESTRFERVQGKDLEVVPLVEGKLGLDSPTDHLLLNVAVHRSKTWKNGISLILTADAGLILETSSQRRENKHNVLTSFQTDLLKKVVAQQLFTSPASGIPDTLYPDYICSWDTSMKREDFEAAKTAVSKRR